MTDKPPDLSDLNTMAIEACDMWQEHLSAIAGDPNARAELTRFLEPQRRMFADWISMMQQGGASDTSSSAQKTDAASDDKPAPATSSAASGSPSHGDDPLRTAQLALRVAELEKRIAQLEATISQAAKRTQRSAS